MLGHLATGGMAEIFLGRILGPGGFERPVVIKRMLPHLGREDRFVKMFLDEARIIAGIRHPNVVQVQELGHDGEDLFLVMEYLDGESVAGLTRRLVLLKEPIATPLAAHVIAEACAGLHAAHELTDATQKPLGLVHRDISPQNLFVTYGGEVKVLDFGIAKAADRIARTETGQIKGKVGYMSPEQCVGAPVDRRSDVFALGVVLYELATGRRLFQRRNQLLVMKAICEEPVTPPSKLVPGFPAELEAVILRALARAPADRFADAAEMRRALVACTRALEGAGEVCDQLLGRLMQRIFKDRLEEKREMLSRVAAGSVPSVVPLAEVDLAVDLPSTVPDRPERAALAEDEARGARSSRRLVLGAAAMLLVVATGATWIGVRQGEARRREVLRREEPPATAIAPRSAAAIAPVVETGSVSGGPSAAEARVTIRIETNPPDARVLIAGEERARTPADIEIERSTEPIEVAIERTGFVPLTQRLVPDVPQRMVLALEPVRAPPRSKGARRPAGQKPQVKASKKTTEKATDKTTDKSPFHRF